MPLSESEELELLQLEREKYGVGGQGRGPSQQGAPGSSTPPPESWGHWAGRQALESLSPAGLVVGGMLGAPEGGVGAVPGAALGYAGGKQLERLGKQYLLGDKEDVVPEKPLDQAKQVGPDLARGALYEMAGQSLNKILSPVGQYISKRFSAKAPEVPVEAPPQSAPESEGGWDPLSKSREKLPFVKDEVPFESPEPEVAPTPPPVQAPSKPAKPPTPEKHFISRNIGASLGRSFGHMTGIPGAGWLGDLIGGTAGEAVGEFGAPMAQALKNTASSKVGSFAESALPFSNIVSKAISTRLGEPLPQPPAGIGPNSSVLDQGSLRDEFLSQQTSPEAQERLKKYQGQ